MPEKLKKARYNNQFKNNNYSHNSQGAGSNSVEYGGAAGANGSFSQHFSPNQYMSNNFGQQNTMIQITNIADIAAIGGFNPNKYLSPPPQPIPLLGSSGAPPAMMPQPQFNVTQFQSMLAGNGTSSPVQQAPAPQAAGQSDASALKAESSAVTKDLAEKTAPAVAAQ